MKRLAFCAILTCATYSSPAQQQLILSPGITLPKDTAIAASLIDQLNKLLAAVESDSTTCFISSSAKVHTQDLLDEMKGIRGSGKYKNKQFYKPYLQSVESLTDTSFMLQLFFMGVADTLPVVRAAFDLLAYHSGSGNFLFSSPILMYTQGWKTKRIGNINFHYPDKLNVQQAEAYSRYVSMYDKKIGNKDKIVEYYTCSTTIEALHILGVSYKPDYNGRQAVSLTSSGDNMVVTVSSGSLASFDPHDLWHARLQQAVPAKLINRPVDEGCAYLYGGSWGLTWKEILKMFKSRVATRDTDWLSVYESGLNFADPKQPELMASYVINALLVEKIEKEKGFASVMDLLKAGPAEKGNNNYFDTLDRIAGINRNNYNKVVWKLVEKAGN